MTRAKDRQGSAARPTPHELRQAEAEEADRLIEELAKQRDKQLGLSENTRDLPTQVRRQAAEADRMMVKETGRLGDWRTSNVSALIHPGAGVADTKLTTDVDEDYIRKLEKNLKTEKLPDAEIEKRVKKARDKEERKEQKIKTHVDGILPGAWPEFKTICAMSSGIKTLADQNKTAPMRQGVRRILAATKEFQQIIESLPPAIQSLLPPESTRMLGQIEDAFRVAESELDGLPDGKQPLEHRDYLAREIRDLMRRHEVEPRSHADYIGLDGAAETRGRDTRFSELVRRAIIMVEGSQPADLRPIVSRALKGQ